MRIDPQGVMSQSGISFIVDRITRPDNRSNEGFRVIIEQYEDWPVKRWKLRRYANSQSESARLDYYFPYVNGHNVGWVNVNNPVDGTIVTTDQMNGCALEVCVNPDGSYTFYHDTNGRNMDTVHDKGETICRIEGDSYLNDDLARTLSKGDNMPLVQIICVYKANGSCWHVGCFGIIVNPNNSLGQYEIRGSFAPNGGCYRGYFNRYTNFYQIR